LFLQEYLIEQGTEIISNNLSSFEDNMMCSLPNCRQS